MNPSLLSWLGVLPLLPATVTLAQSDGLPEILPMRKRAQLHDRWLEHRLDSVVPMLMRREGIDCWVLVAREYNEDPVVETMLPAKWLRARRRTILVFHDAGSDPGVQRYAVARYAVGELFPGAWDKAEEPDQWKCLAELLAELDPSRIALNVSEDFALADGMAHSEHESLVGALSPALRTRIVSGQALALGWLETRTEMELAVYPEICEIAHIIISEGYESVRPGVTTTADLEWWYRERVAELKLDTWFHPSASVQRHEAGEHSGSFASRPDARRVGAPGSGCITVHSRERRPAWLSTPTPTSQCSTMCSKSRPCRLARTEMASASIERWRSSPPTTFGMTPPLGWFDFTSAYFGMPRLFVWSWENRPRVRGRRVCSFQRPTRAQGLRRAYLPGYRRVS